MPLGGGQVPSTSSAQAFLFEMASKSIRVKREGFQSRSAALSARGKGNGGEPVVLEVDDVHGRLAMATGLLPIFPLQVVAADGREVPETFDAFEAFGP